MTFLHLSYCSILVQIYTLFKSDYFHIFCHHLFIIQVSGVIHDEIEY